MDLLTRTHNVIFLPTFETANMVAKVKWKIKSKTARALLMIQTNFKTSSAFGIFLKALRDTASITVEGDSAIVALSGNSRKNVS